MSLPFEPRDEDRRLLTGAGRFCDDDRAARRGACRLRPLASCLCRDPRHRHARGPVAAGSPGGADRRRHGTGRHRQCDARQPGPERRRGLSYRTARRWPATASAMPARPSRLSIAESEAIARDGAELVAVDYEAARSGHRCRGGGAFGGAAALARGAGQYRARLARIRRHRARHCRCRFRRGRACRAGPSRQSAHRHGADGAARRAGALRRRQRSLHSVLRLAERLCAAAEPGALHGAAAGAHPRPERRCRRRFRHARDRLSGIPGAAGRGTADRPRRCAGWRAAPRGF